MRLESQLVGSGQETAGIRQRCTRFGRSGRTRLLMLVTNDGAPGLVKSATFQFSGWDDASKTFDVLAAVAGIVQETCLDENGTVEAAHLGS
jgi:hypothetical protein